MHAPVPLVTLLNAKHSPNYWHIANILRTLCTTGGYKCDGLNLDKFDCKDELRVRTHMCGHVSEKDVGNEVGIKC